MFKKILFCTDFSENSQLFILHVSPVPNDPEQLSIYLPTEKIQELMKAQRNELEKKLNNHYGRKLKEFKNYKILIKQGWPFIEIIQMAKKESVDLIVMGTHGRTGLDHILFGSTAEHVVQKSPCPVLTIRLPGKKFIMP